MPRLFSLFILILGSQILLAQAVLQGEVLNEEKEPLAFVHVLVNGDAHRGQSSDIDGQFTILDLLPQDSLVFRYLGYEDLIYYPTSNDFTGKVTITLKAKAYSLQTAEVIAGENPAHRIIKKAVMMRDTHNPDKLKSYRCQTYNKLKFDWLPDYQGMQQLRGKEKPGKIDRLRANRFDDLTGNIDRQHALMVESLTEREFLKPEHLQELVLHKRVSGFKHPTFVALANSVQPFSCYQTHISLLGKDFLNPISKGSTDNYFFVVADSLFQGPDTIFVISYQPKKGTTFDGLKGVVYIHTNGYGVQSIIGTPNDPGALHMRIEQRYQLVQDATKKLHWFPDQLNFEIEAAHYPDKFLGMKISGRSYIRKVEIEPGLKLKDFGLEGIRTAPNADVRADSVWQKVRLKPLTLKESNTYFYMDSIGEERKLDRYLTAMEVLISGLIPLGPVAVDLMQTMSFNALEEVRLGMGLKTTERFSRRLSMGANLGYGLRDKTWKYGGFMDYTLGRRKEIKAGFSYRQDIEEPAVRKFALQSQLFSSRNYAFRFDEIESYQGHVEGWLLPYTFFDFTLDKSFWRPVYSYQYGLDNDFLQRSFNFTEFRLSMRYAHGERFTRILGTRVREASLFPVLQLTYARGIEGLLGGDFDYHRLLVSAEYEYNFKTLGSTYLLVEAAWAKGDLPYQKLFDTNGLGREFRFLLDEHTFHTMDPYEFLSDQFVEVFFQHNFGAIFGKWKFIQPELSIVHNFTIGTLANPELHHDIVFNTLEKGYYEAGLILDTIVGINYFNVGTIGVGLGGFYRYGSYARPNWKDNIGVQMTLNFGML